MHLPRSLSLFFLIALISGASPALASGSLAAKPNADPAFSNVKVSSDQYLAHSEPHVAENPANPKNLIAGSKMFTDPDNYEFKIGMYYSMNGGKSWTDVGWLPGYDSYE